MIVLRDPEIPISEVGVYVLIRNEVPVYVGMTTTRTTRVAQHAADPDKVFDSVQFIPCPGDVARLVERALIATLRPKLNKQVPLPLAGPDEREDRKKVSDAIIPRKAPPEVLTRIEKEANRMVGFPRVAEYCGVTVEVIRSAARAGELRVAVAGRRGSPHVFAVSEVDRWRASFIQGLKIEETQC